jgi:hypothetical protein
MPVAAKYGGDPPTRWGGLLASALKNSLEAATAEAAVRAEPPSFSIEVVSAA